MVEENDDSEPLAFLEKSHCISIIQTLARNGMMNRNQLYKELGENINIVIKRVDLLLSREIVHEFEIPVKPFAKYLALTEKGRSIADHLDAIENILTIPGTVNVYRVNFPFDMDTEEIKLAEKQPNFKEYVRRKKEQAPDIKCKKCGELTYLAKDKKKYVWVCMHCGYKVKAEFDDIATVAVAERY